MLRERFKRKLSYKPEFIAVLEEAKGQLHAHLLIGYPKGQEETIQELLRQDSQSRRNGVLMSQSFRRWSRARPGSVEFDLEELDREEGKANFPTLGVRGSFSGYYRNCSVDAGWLDYLTKAFNSRSGLIGGYRKFYCPNHIAKKAEETYTRMRSEHLENVK